MTRPGLVERANGYLETSFLPGRSFTSPADFNIQLESWLQRANQRQHRASQARPADRIDADRAAMVALPPVPPATGWRFSTRLPRDHYVRVEANDYSVPGSATIQSRASRSGSAQSNTMWMSGIMRSTVIRIADGRCPCAFAVPDQPTG